MSKKHTIQKLCLFLFQFPSQSFLHTTIHLLILLLLSFSPPPPRHHKVQLQRPLNLRSYARHDTEPVLVHISPDKPRLKSCCPFRMTRNALTCVSFLVHRRLELLIIVRDGSEWIASLWLLKIRWWRRWLPILLCSDHDDATSSAATNQQD